MPAKKPPVPVPVDPWGVWFFRFVQLLGVAAIVNELVLRPEPRDVAVFAALAMISGALGIERFIQWRIGR